MILIFDPFSGISGDMTVGALLDAGLPLAHLQEACRALKIAGLAFDAEPVVRAGFRATKFRVRCEQAAEQRHLSHIQRMIDQSDLAPAVREVAHGIFRKLAEAEAKVHGTTEEKVHFHEVGALDSIADIIGAAVGFDYFKIGQFFSSPVNVGYGTVQCDHGILPVPAPATALLLAEFETFSGSVRSEMTTPTGAAILAALARPVPAALAARRRLIGYGAGDRDFRETPNLLRIFIGPPGEGPPGEQEIVELQTNIDDMNPQFYGPLLQKLIAEGGALDVFYHPVVMKQGRPGVLLTVLCEAPRREKIAGMLFRETTTLGVRYLSKRREILNRSFVPVITRFGQVRIKVASSDSDVINYAAEFEDCQRLARAAGVPLKDVYNEAMAAYWETRAERKR